MNKEIEILEEKIEAIEEIEILSENIPAVIDGSKHNTLIDRNDADAHTISAITGLEDKLNAIEALKDRIGVASYGHADYYKWVETEDIGPCYFVKLVNDKICKCTNETIVSLDSLPLDEKEIVEIDEWNVEEVKTKNVNIIYSVMTDDVTTYYNNENGEWIIHNTLDEITHNNKVAIYNFAINITKKDANLYYVVRSNDTQRYARNIFDIYGYDGIQYVNKSIYSYDKTNDEIKKTCGTADVFGVTVENAGFMGNDVEDGRINDITYALVATSGLVDVMCDSTIVVGDYVVPTTGGLATKSTGAYGYAVTEIIENPDGTHCARIILAPSVLHTQAISNNVDYLLAETKRLDDNLIAVGNTAAEALYEAKQLTKDAQNSASDAQQSAQNAKDWAQQSAQAAQNAWDSTDGVKELAEQAKKDAEHAQEMAANIREEAIAAGTQAAIEAAGGSIEYLKALAYRQDEYSVGQYSQAYGLTFEQAKILVKPGTVFIPMSPDFSEKTYTEVYESDPDVTKTFSMGFSYIWTIDGWDGGTQNVTYEPSYKTGVEGQYWFVPDTYKGTDYEIGALYRWEKPEGGSYGWQRKTNYAENNMARSTSYLRRSTNSLSMEMVSVKNDVAAVTTEINDTESLVGLVASRVVEMDGVIPANYNSDTETIDIIVDEETLNGDTWRAHAQGKGDGVHYYVVGSSKPYDVYKWSVVNGTPDENPTKESGVLYDGVNFSKINTASIITSVNESGDSSITLNADRINFDCDDYTIAANKILFTAQDYDVISDNITFDSTNIKFTGEDLQAIAEQINLDGYVTFTSLEETGHKTSINGGYIQSGTISADKIDTSHLVVKTQNLDGKILADQIETENLHVASAATAKKVEVEELSAISSNLGTVTTGEIQSPNYNNPEIVIWNDEDEVVEDTCLLDYTLNYDETYYIITGIGTCTDTDITIPSIINDKPVVEIGEAAFRLNGNIISVVIPDSVTKINSSAFQGCSALKTVKIGNSVEQINSAAFMGCESLTFIAIPDSVTSIGASAFRQCFKLNSTIIGSNISSIDVYAFDGCDNLTNVYYKGLVDDWTKITLGDGNGLTNATIHYYSEEEPEAEGNYWHYGSDGFKISCDDEWMIDSKDFKVTRDGQIVATNAYIRGTINANDGVIGGLRLSKSDENENFREKTAGPFYQFVNSDGSVYESISKFISDSIIGEPTILCYTNGIEASIGYDSSTQEYTVVLHNTFTYPFPGITACFYIVYKKLYDNTYLQSNDSSFVVASMDHDTTLMCDNVEIGNLDVQKIKSNECNASSGRFGDINLQNDTIQCRNTVIDLDYFDGSGDIYCKAKLSWLTSRFFVEVFDSNDAYYQLPYEKSFRIAYKTNQNKEQYAFRSIIVPANSYGGTYDLPGTSYLSTPQIIDATFASEDFTPLNTTEIDIGLVAESQHSFISFNKSLIPSVTSEEDSGTITGYNGFNLGDSKYFWNTIYVRNSEIDLSDRNVKNTIQPLTEEHTQIFDALQPVSYKFNTSNNNRTHMGLIAQDVKEAVENAGLTTQDFAGYCEWEKEDGTIGCGLRYSEFIAMCINEIQKLKKRVEELETKQND